MYIKDLVRVLKTNLTITKKWYMHGRYHIQITLFHYLAGFFRNQSYVVLNLCYCHIVITLLQDLKGRSYQILIKFMCEFTKKYLSMKDK